MTKIARASIQPTPEVKPEQPVAQTSGWDWLKAAKAADEGADVNAQPAPYEEYADRVTAMIRSVEKALVASPYHFHFEVDTDPSQSNSTLVGFARINQSWKLYATWVSKGSTHTKPLADEAPVYVRIEAAQFLDELVRGMKAHYKEQRLAVLRALSASADALRLLKEGE